MLYLFAKGCPDECCPFFWLALIIIANFSYFFFLSSVNSNWQQKNNNIICSITKPYSLLGEVCLNVSHPIINSRLIATALWYSHILFEPNWLPHNLVVKVSLIFHYRIIFMHANPTNDLGSSSVCFLSFLMLCSFYSFIYCLLFFLYLPTLWNFNFNIQIFHCKQKCFQQ